MSDAPVIEVAAVPAPPEAKKPRKEFRNKDWTAELVAAKKAELSSEIVPTTEDGRAWIKHMAVSDACRLAAIPVSRWVRATGGDRGMFAPMEVPGHPGLFLIKFVGRTRYVHPDCLTFGIEFLKADANFPRALTTKLPKTPKEPKAAKPKVEGAAKAKHTAADQGVAVPARPAGKPVVPEAGKTF